MFRTTIVAALATALFALTGCGVSSTPQWMEARTGRPSHEAAAHVDFDRRLALDRSSSARGGEVRAERTSARAASR